MNLTKKIICWSIFLILFFNVSKNTIGTSQQKIELVKLGQIGTGGDVYDIWIDEEKQIAFVTCGYGGLKIYDISDPSSITEISNLPEIGRGYAHRLFIDQNNVIYIGDGFGGLKIIDCSNPSNPLSMNQIHYANYTYDVEVVGSTAFIADGEYGLVIADCTNLSHPTTLSQYSTGGYATNIQIEENIAYLADGINGLMIFDVINTSNPLLIGQCGNQSTEEEGLGSIAILGDLAFLAYWQRGLDIYNISDVSNIKVLNHPIDCVSSVSVELDTDENLAFVADYMNGLKVLDFSNPSQPNLIGIYNETGIAYGLHISDNLIYFADAANGLIILKIVGDSSGTQSFELQFALLSLVVLLITSGKIKKGKRAESKRIR